MGIVVATSRRLRESRESVNGGRRCIASFLLEFGEKLKRLKTQKSTEWVCVGARVVSYLFSQNTSVPLIARKDVGGGFLVLPLSASCGGLWCGGVCAVPLVARAAGVHWSLVSCAVSLCCSAGRSCGGHPLVARGAMGFVLFCWSLVRQASCCFIARVVCRCVKAACCVDGCSGASCRAGLTKCSDVADRTGGMWCVFVC